MIHDINLIPRVKKKASGELTFITITLVLGLMVLTIFYGFYLPMQQKNSLIAQITEQEAELLNYSGTQHLYLDLLNQVQNINNTDEIINTIKASNIEIAKFMRELEVNIPPKVIIKNMSLTDGILNMEGTAPSYKEIAQYIVNLRNMNSVYKVTLMGAKKEEANEATEAFTIYVSLISPEVVSELPAEQSVNDTSTVEEVTSHETY
ncbi:MAG: hypothetical protein K0S76_671 [Herbinix sp.]|jgi:Tfp pilus assembly protein PilN|nr:hypothetical protein [Herbinix sp.]